MPLKTGWNIHESLTACENNPAAQWEFIRNFALHWTSTPLTDNSSFTVAQLTAAEGRLRMTFPASLKDAYKLLGQRTDLLSNQDEFLSPEELYIDQQGNGDRALVFRTENQAAAIWGIALPCTSSNPPVSMLLSLSHKEAEKWQPWAFTFSEALVEIVLSESLFDPTAFTYISFEECDVSEADKRFRRLPFPRYHPESGSTLSWFTHGPNLLLRHDGSEIMIRARTEDAVQRLQEEHGDLFTNLVPNGYI